MLNVVTMLFVKPQPQRNAEFGVQPFWAEQGPTYLRRLLAGIARHVPQPHRVYVMTDSPELIPEGATALPLFIEQVEGQPPLWKSFPGWWAKLRMFDAALGLEGKTLYLDLDNVLSGDLSALVALEPDPLLMMDDRHYPGTANASTLLCYPERLRFLWDDYVKEPRKWLGLFSRWPHASDQAYMAHQVRKTGAGVPYMQDKLPPGYVLNSRVELEKGADWSQTHLVFGCWIPKPHESKHPFYAQHWID